MRVRVKDRKTGVIGFAESTSYDRSRFEILDDAPEPAQVPVDPEPNVVDDAPEPDVMDDEDDEVEED